MCACPEPVRSQLMPVNSEASLVCQVMPCCRRQSFPPPVPHGLCSVLSAHRCLKKGLPGDALLPRPAVHAAPDLGQSVLQAEMDYDLHSSLQV